MIWDILFWLTLVFLVAMVIGRLLFVPKDKPKGKKRGKAAPTPNTHPFLKGWTWPLVTVLLFALSLVMRLDLDLFAPSWSDEERIEVEFFAEAMDLYDRANEVVNSGNLEKEDWESVNALLQASQSNLAQVSDEILDRIHPELKSNVQDKFFPGLSAGIYGISHHTADRQKGTDTVEHHGWDSLELGRSLLGEWVEWYEANQVKITRRLNP